MIEKTQSACFDCNTIYPSTDFIDLPNHDGGVVLCTKCAIKELFKLYYILCEDIRDVQEP